MGPIAAENRVKPWSKTQNQAKRINKIVFLSLLRDQGVGGSNPLSPTILFNHLSCLCLPCETRAQPSNPFEFRRAWSGGTPIAPFRRTFPNHSRFALLSVITKRANY